MVDTKATATPKGEHTGLSSFFTSSSKRTAEPNAAVQNAQKAEPSGHTGFFPPLRRASKPDAPTQKADTAAGSMSLAGFFTPRAKTPEKMPEKTAESDVDEKPDGASTAPEDPSAGEGATGERPPRWMRGSRGGQKARRAKAFMSQMNQQGTEGTYAPCHNIFDAPEQIKPEVSQSPAYRAAYDWTFTSMLQQALLVTGLGGMEVMSTDDLEEHQADGKHAEVAVPEIEPKNISSALLGSPNSEVQQAAKDLPMYVHCTSL